MIKNLPCWSIQINPYNQNEIMWSDQALENVPGGRR